MSMRKDRLMKLIEFAESGKIPKERFNMARFFTRHGRMSSLSTSPRCASVGCIFAWATAVPAFRRAGLQLNRYTGAVAFVTGRGPLYNYGAALEFFGLDAGQAHTLFAGSLGLAGITTPKKWAKRARGLVAKWCREEKRATRLASE